MIGVLLIPVASGASVTVTFTMSVLGMHKAGVSPLGRLPFSEPLSSPPTEQSSVPGPVKCICKVSPGSFSRKHMSD